MNTPSALRFRLHMTGVVNIVVVGVRLQQMTVTTAEGCYSLF